MGLCWDIWSKSAGQCREAVRRERHRRGLSQEDLAFEAELHRTYVSEVERGKRNISLVNIHRLAKALKIKPRDLL